MIPRWGIEWKGGEIQMKVYAHFVEPEHYETYDPITNPAVTHADLGDRVHFTGLKYMSIDHKTGHLSDLENDVRLFTEEFELCDCLWVHWTALKADNICDLVDAVRARGIYLGGFWGFVPGTKADTPNQLYWGEFDIPDELDAYFRAQLQGHFLGYESGEDDGRYIGAYALRSSVSGSSHRRGYRSFHEFFERIGNTLQNRLLLDSSLNLVHYQAKEGNVVMLGAETAQALPNTQITYAFIRGAAREYGLLTFGNISVWNRWGYKNYSSSLEKKAGGSWGPTKGASVSLLRRLFYQEMFYNCDMLGFSQGWLVGEEVEKWLIGEQSKLINTSGEITLTPIGRVQQYAMRFTKEHGKLGVFYAPVAIILDFYSGWIPPRHLYSSSIYKTWGSHPYNEGDYQTHALFEQLYPGYENASWYRNEAGFLTATPLGDMTDVLLSDVDPHIMEQYRLLILTNGIEWNCEFYQNLLQYVRQGGRLLLCAGTFSRQLSRLCSLDPAFLTVFGLESLGELLKPEETTVVFDGCKYSQEDVSLYDCRLLPNTEVVAAAGNQPVICRTAYGAGHISLILSDNGMEPCDSESLPYNMVDNDIVCSFAFGAAVQAYIAKLYGELQLARPDNGKLQYAVAVQDERHFMLQVINNTHLSQAFDIQSSFTVESVEPVLIEDDVYLCKGYYPENVEINNDAVNGSGSFQLTAGDIGFYQVSLAKNELELMPECLPKRSVRNLYVNLLPGQESLKQFVLDHPTLNQKFAGVMVDTDYFNRHDAQYLVSEAAFLKRRGIRIVLNFLPVLNHYPNLSFLRAFPERYERSMDYVTDILKKVACFDCAALVVGVMRNSEILGTIEELKHDLMEAFESIHQQAKSPIFYQNCPIVLRIEEGYEMASETMRLSLDVSAAMCIGASLQNVCENYDIHALSLSAPAVDAYGQYYNAHQPVFSSPMGAEIRENVRAIMMTSDMEYMVMAAEYENWDEVILDYRYLFEEEQQPSKK